MTVGLISEFAEDHVCRLPDPWPSGELRIIFGIFVFVRLLQENDTQSVHARHRSVAQFIPSTSMVFATEHSNRHRPARFALATEPIMQYSAAEPWLNCKFPSRYLAVSIQQDVIFTCLVGMK